MRNIILSFAFILLGFSQLLAQGSIKGNISDADGETLPGAYIVIQNTNFYAVSDIKGNFEIYGIPSGDYTLEASYIGYVNKAYEIAIVDKSSLSLNILMDNDNVMEEVVINGRLEGQAKAMNSQKNSLNITEVIASEQIERFPDANVGDALKRLSGINVQYDQGEARFANIRGTAPELNSITINGERVPSAEGEKRYVQLDLIPADVVETIEVNKAITPDMDGDAIGGSINLVTQKAKPNQSLSGTLGSGYSVLTKKPLYKGKLKYSNRFVKNKVGLILTASVLDKHVRSDNYEVEWIYDDENNKDASAYPEDFQIRQYYLERLRQSYSGILDFNLADNHNIYLTGMYNWRNDWENRYRFRFKGIEKDGDNYIGEIRKQTKGGVKDNKYGRLEDQKMMSAGIGGDHYFNKLKLNWFATVQQASEDRPSERYISMRDKKVPFSINLKDITKPQLTILDDEAKDLSSAYSLKELTEENGYITERDINGRVDLELPILTGVNSSFLKFGGRYKSKTKKRTKEFFEYEPKDEDAFISDALNNIDDQTNEDFSAEGYKAGSFVKKEFIGDLDLGDSYEKSEVLEELAGQFDALENVLGGYAMYTQNITEKWTLLGGVRLEHTSVDYQGKKYNGETLEDTKRKKDAYLNVLPGVHVKYSPNRWANVKFAWTNSLSRPNYFDLVPYQEIDTEDNRIKIGNASLEATTSMNLDLLGEYYFKNLGLISGGLFYKDLKNVIAEKSKIDFEFEGNTYDRFTQPVNAGDAVLYGFELGLQRRLNFLPSFLSNLSIYGNYTYTKSELKNISLEDRKDEVLPLVGTPEHVFNTSLAYDTKKFDIRVSYNYAGQFIEEYNDEPFYDRWYDAVNYLDVNADYKISKKWKLYLSVNNLLNQPLRYYQGVDARTMQVEYYGIQGKIGLKFNIL